MTPEKTIWDGHYQKFGETSDANERSLWGKGPTAPIINNLQRLNRIEDGSIKRVADLASGDGRNAKGLVESGFEVTGFDGSSTGTQRAKENVPDATFVVHNLLQPIPVDGELYDAAICDYLTVHLTDAEMETFLKNAFNIIKPGGYFVVEFLSTSDPSYIEFQEGKKHGATPVEGNPFAYNYAGIHNNFHSKERAQKALKKAGFFVTLTEGNYHEDPPHTPPYPREGAHTHHSIYLVCRKPGRPQAKKVKLRQERTKKKAIKVVNGL